MARANEAEILQRVAQVKELLLTGNTRSDVLQFASKSGWNIVPRAVDDYIAKANDEIQEINEETFEKTRSKVLRGLWDCFYRARAKEDTKCMIAALKTIGEFTGLTEIVVKMKQERLSDFDDEKVMEVLTQEAVH